MHSLLRDIRFGSRLLLKRPGFTLVIILTLALGIGANTALFSVVNAILLRPLPMKDPERLVRIRQTSGQEGFRIGLTPTTFQAWQEKNQVCEEMAAATGQSMTLTGFGEPEYLQAGLITWNYLHVLGVPPQLGRDFLPEEGIAGKNQAVLLGDGLWRRRFGADPAILGKPLIFNGQSYTVVGVLPPKFSHPYEAEIWVPLVLNTPEMMAQSANLYVPARLKPGVSLVQAQAALTQLAGQINQAAPNPQNPTGAHLIGLRDELVEGLATKLWILQAATVFVLLICCANVANLYFAQVFQQQGELAIRTALGASRWQLLRQLMVQSLLLSGLGAIAGIAVAYWSQKPLLALSPLAPGPAASAITQIHTQVSLDLTSLGFALAVTLLVAILFGLIPALKASNTNPHLILRETTRTGGMTARRQHWLNGLVVIEFALAIVLLAGAGLMIRSFLALQNVQWGFSLKQTLTFDLNFSESRYPNQAQRLAFIQTAMTNLRNIQGVQSVGATTVQPLYRGTFLSSYSIEGRQVPDPPGYYICHHRRVLPGYFQTIGIPILSGSDFSGLERIDTEPVILISKMMADRFWPGENPIGRRIKSGRLDSNGPWFTVVGVVGDVKESVDPNDGEVVGTWYLPYTQQRSTAFSSISFVVKTDGAPENVTAAIREAIWAIDRDQAIYNVATFEHLAKESFRPERFSTTLILLFGVVGLILAVVGIYGVVSYSLVSRIPEIGIRLAFGASPLDIFKLILQHGASLIAAGLTLGLIAAGLLSQYLKSQLFGVSELDPASYAMASFLLAIVALVACAVPAIRAMKVDPVTALRQD